jgi:two-component system sensor histidine kinase PilS (NtrC family)
MAGREAGAKTAFNEQVWLSWLVRVRGLVITLVLAIEFALEKARPAVSNRSRFLVIVIAWYLAAAFFIFLLHAWRDQRLQARLQIVTDLVFATALIYVTGGVDTLFNFLYPLIIIVAAIMLPVVWAFLTAVLAFILYGGVLELSFFGLIPSFAFTRPDVASLQAAIFVNLIAYLAIAYLASRLVSKLRIVKGELEIASDALENLQRLHERIIDSMTSGIISTGLDGRIAVVNPAGVRLLGRPQQELVGLPITELFGDGLPSAGDTRGELRYRRPGVSRERGQIFGIGACALRSGEGEVQGLLYTFTDLTEIRRLERELRTRDRLAAVGRLASGIAHEIRNPLTAIAGSAQMLGASAGLGGDEQQLLKIVRRESERLNQIVTDFLSYSRDQRCRLAPRELAPLLADTLRLLENRPECRDGRVRIERSFPADPMPALVDADRAQQVFWNLSDNALRAMPTGGTLRVRLWADAAGVHSSFTDSGIGMERCRLDAIFEPFNSGFARGAGLGLAIVYQIMQAHGGSVAVASEPGKGTTFTLHFQRALAAVPAAGAGGPQDG